MDVKVIINGNEVKVDSNSTILEAASSLGIKIPVLCYLKRLRPLCSCRVCVVEIKGLKGLLPACVAKPKEGYDIITESERIWETRRNVISNLLLKHPLDCPVCDKSGDCLLQDLSFEFGITSQENERKPIIKKFIFKNDYIEYNYERCVLCSRCIRACSDMYGDPFLMISKERDIRHIDVKIKEEKKTNNEEDKKEDFLSKSPKVLNCYNCGACIEVCPVGALISKGSKFKERFWMLEPFSSVCDKCSAMCDIEFYRYPEEETLARTSAPDLGFLCKEGFFYEGIGKGSGYYIDRPLIRHKNAYKDVSIEKSLSDLSNKIQDIYKKGEMKNTAVLVSSSLSSDDGFLVANFVKNVLKPGFFDIAESNFYRQNFELFKKLFPENEIFDVNEIMNSGLIIYIGSIEDEIPLVLYKIMKSDREKRAKIVEINVNFNKREKSSPGRFEDLAFISTKIDPARINNFLYNIKDVLQHSELKKLDKNALEEFCLDEDEMTICQALTKSPSVSIIIGDNVMSERLLQKEFETMLDIVNCLKKNERKANIFPLIKPFNYRGLKSAGIGSNADNGANSYNGSGDCEAIMKAMESGSIKNLIYIGDFSNNRYTKELTKHIPDLKFFSIISSKISIFSSLADIIIPIEDYLEKRKGYFENFEGKKIIVHNKFNFGFKSDKIDIKRVLLSLSANLGYSEEVVMVGFDKFNDLFSKNFKEYGTKPESSKFYYNFRGKLLY